MMCKRLSFVILLVVLPSLLCFSQEAPVSVSVCELQQNPTRFDKMLLRLKAGISIAFEDFTLASTSCPEPRTGVWLEFGGDVGTPAVYCCGAHTRQKGSVLQLEGISLPVVKDNGLKTLLRVLKKQKWRESAKTLTATLEGRFFARQQQQLPNGESQYVGYGHFGFFSLFVIQRVSDVTLQ